MEAETAAAAARNGAAPPGTALSVAFTRLDSGALVLLTTSLTFDKRRQGGRPARVVAVRILCRTPILIPTLDRVLCASRGCLTCRHDLTRFFDRAALVNEATLNMSRGIPICKQVTRQRKGRCF